MNPEHLAHKLDDLVAPAAEPENAVLVDQSRLIRWVGPAFALFAVLMLPWIAYIGFSLPSRQLSPNYDIAWFDCMTTPADSRWQSFVFCFCVELPLAAVCMWLSYHTEQLAAQRIRLLLHGLRPFRRR